eukprot:7191132-Pyramimonas_sp.AAC.1
MSLNRWRIHLPPKICGQRTPVSSPTKRFRAGTVYKGSSALRKLVTATVLGGTSSSSSRSKSLLVKLLLVLVLLVLLVLLVEVMLAAGGLDRGHLAELSGFRASVSKRLRRAASRAGSLAEPSST